MREAVEQGDLALDGVAELHGSPLSNSRRVRIPRLLDSRQPPLVAQGSNERRGQQERGYQALCSRSGASRGHYREGRHGQGGDGNASVE